jgi:dTDP-L-rhamnose 4-epimerase
MQERHATVPDALVDRAVPSTGPRDMMSVMRVLVTGGAGFIGSHVASALLQDGHEVRVLDSLLPAAWGDSVPVVDPRVNFVRGDVRDSTVVRSALDGIEVVCHQAAMVGLGVDLRDLPEYATHNDLGTAVVLAEMATAGVGRLVLASSMVVYGEGRWTCPRDGDVAPRPRAVADLDAGRFDPRCPSCGDGLAWDLVEESAPLDPRSVYAASKVAQEHLASAWQRGTGGEVVALRYHNVYGPMMPKDTPYSGVAAIFRSWLEQGRVPQVFEDGGQMRDFIHVTDVARANVCAISASTEGFVPLNVCSGEPHTVGQLAHVLAAEIHGGAPKVTGRYRLGDVRHVVASPARAVEVLGFRATVSFDAGVREFARAPLR